MFRKTVAVPALLVLCTLLGASPASAQKYGGILKSVQRANPAHLSIHETSTINTQWAMSPVYNNLLYQDPLQVIETFDTVIPDLAKSWAWSADNLQLTFKLHEGVKWHDGSPFTARDVKYTFDLVRGVAEDKLRLNPRKGWFANVKDITTRGDHEVTFHLARPQPSLVLLLAAGYSVIYPAHVPSAKLRTETMGTGPFRLVEYKRDQVLKVRKNQDYFVKGRPYLDGIDYIVIRSKATQMASLVAGQVDITMPTETGEKQYQALKQAVPDMVFNKVHLGNNVNILLNNKRPPFNDARLRRAISMAVDRNVYVRAVEPGYLPGAIMLPRPHGGWGLAAEELKGLPGYRDPALDKEEARKVMRELGYGEAKRLQVKVTTRTPANYQTGATWLLSELKQIYIDAEMEVLEDGSWYPRQARRDYAIAWNGTGYAVDDPDVVYTENYTCNSQRNYSDYCDPEAEALFARQSSMVDRAERSKLVLEIERKLINDVARVSMGFRTDYNARRSYVKNFVGHNTVYTFARMQDVWLDK